MERHSSPWLVPTGGGRSQKSEICADPSQMLSQKRLQPSDRTRHNMHMSATILCISSPDRRPCELAKLPYRSAPNTSCSSGACEWDWSLNYLPESLSTPVPPSFSMQNSEESIFRTQMLEKEPNKLTVKGDDIPGLVSTDADDDVPELISADAEDDNAPAHVNLG